VLTPLDPDLVRFAEHLEAHDIPCMVVGSVASTVWGEPRSTLDIDLVVAAKPEDAERIAAIFHEPRYYAPPVAVMRREIARGGRGTFNLIDTATGLKADIYPGADDPVNVWGMARRVPVETGVGIIFIAPVSCVIAGKLRYYAMSRQDKHLRDIRGMLRLTASQLDRGFVDEVAQQHGVVDAWADCLARPGVE
jgi:hypothetical protein